MPMLWAYGHYKYVYSYSAEIDFSRQNLTSVDVRFCRLKGNYAVYAFSVMQIMIKNWNITSLMVEGHSEMSPRKRGHVPVRSIF